MGRVKKFISKIIAGKRRRYPTNIKLGDKVEIAESVVLDSDGESITIGNLSILEHGVYMRLWGGRIVIGESVYIGPYSVLYGHGGLHIEDNVLVASHCTVVPANHNYQDKNTSIRFQGETTKGIVIKEGAWLATGVTVLDGVTIGKNAVVAAGAVVTQNIPDFEVWGGIPAKRIK